MAILRADDKRETLNGVLLMLISGCLCATVAISVQWYSEKTQYSILQILLYISCFQLVFTLISSMIGLSIQIYPSCNIDFSININNIVTSIKSINNIHIHSRRISIRSSRRLSVSQYMNPNMTTLSRSNSTSYGSMTTLLSTQHLINSNRSRSILNNNNDIQRATKHGEISQFFIEKITPKKLWIAILFRGIFGTLSIFAFLESQKIIPLVDTLTLKSFSIITSTIIGYILLDDPLSKYHIIALIIGIIGCILVAQPPFIMQYSSTNYHVSYNWANQWMGYLLAFISSFCTGFAIFCIRITQKTPSCFLILSESICNIIGCGLMIKLWDNDKIGINYNKYAVEDILYAMTFGAILYFSSLTLTKGSQKLIIGASNLIKIGASMIFGLILQIVIFAVYPNWITIIGAAMSVIAVTLISIEKVKKAHRKSLFEMFDTNKYTQYGNVGDTEKDIIDSYYAFDEDEEGGHTTLIM